ncbi:MAG: ATP-binding cassette domain-containing protein [Candidatus Hinthialibacter antarcticus]|nr:ATP-binding cassette domain-containing protein [Candidatus Hinthialibacter antarcticus]
MITVEKLRKTFNRFTAVDDVSFRVEEGEILGFLGPNGAGKTTTMRIITGYTPPSAGTAVVDGHDVKNDPLAVRQVIGYLPENTPLYLDMDVVGFLTFAAKVKGIPSSERDPAIREALEETGTLEVANRTIGKLSKGFRQRVGLAQALLGNPKVLILDEPTVGLDPNQIREIRELIRSMAGKRTVILSTHILPEVSMVCDRVVIINRGHIVAADAVSALSSHVSQSKLIRLTVEAPATEINSALSEIKGVQNIETIEMPGSQCQVNIKSATDADIRPELSNRIVGKGWQLYEIRSMDPTLEDIFVEIIASDKGGVQ